MTDTAKATPRPWHSPIAGCPCATCSEYDALRQLEAQARNMHDPRHGPLQCSTCDILAALDVIRKGD